MKKDLKLADFFPFPEIRPAQDEALAAIEKAHADKKKFVILEIPTGGGKSGIAVAAAKWAKEALGRRNVHSLSSEDFDGSIYKGFWGFRYQRA